MRNRNFNPQNSRNSGYSNQRNNNQNISRSSSVKHSGCGVRIMEDGSPILFGWKLSGGDMVKLYARPCKSTKSSTSKSGKTWLNLFVTLTNQSTMQITKCSGLYNADNQKLYISDFNLIANPRAANGGYFGKHISKTYNR